MVASLSMNLSCESKIQPIKNELCLLETLNDLNEILNCNFLTSKTLRMWQFVWLFFASTQNNFLIYTVNCRTF